MTKFIIKTYDQELANEIWTLQAEGVRIEQSMAKAEGFLAEVIVYVSLAASLFTFARALFELIKSKQKTSQKETITIVHTQKGQADLEKLIISYEKSIHIEVKKED